MFIRIWKKIRQFETVWNDFLQTFAEFGKIFANNWGKVSKFFECIFQSRTNVGLKL